MALLSLDCSGGRVEDGARGRLVGVAGLESLRVRLWLFSRFLREADETVAIIAVRMAAERVKHHRTPEIKRDRKN